MRARVHEHVAELFPSKCGLAEADVTIVDSNNPLRTGGLGQFVRRHSTGCRGKIRFI